MGTLDDLWIEVLKVSEVDQEIRVIIQEIEKLGLELAQISKRRQDQELEILVRKIQAELHTEMDNDSQTFNALYADTQKASQSKNQKLIDEAIETAHRSGVLLQVSRDNLKQLRDQLRQLRDDNEPKS